MPTDLGQDIVRVGVAGCGLMGSGIAELCLRAGLDVMVYEPSAADVSAGRARIEASLQKALDRGASLSVTASIVRSRSARSLRSEVIRIPGIMRSCSSVATFRLMGGKTNRGFPTYGVGQ